METTLSVARSVTVRLNMAAWRLRITMSSKYVPPPDAAIVDVSGFLSENIKMIQELDTSIFFEKLHSQK